MIEQVSFKLGRRDLEAADLDEPLDSVDDEDLVRFIDDDFVAGVNPSVKMVNAGQILPYRRVYCGFAIAPINKSLGGSVSRMRLSGSRRYNHDKDSRGRIIPIAQSRGRCLQAQLSGLIVPRKRPICLYDLRHNPRQEYTSGRTQLAVASAIRYTSGGLGHTCGTRVRAYAQIQCR